MRKSIKTNKIVATKALAHKLARVCYYIMRDQVEFDETKIFKPFKVEKGCAKEPKRGLGHQPQAPIGMAGAALVKGMGSVHDFVTLAFIRLL